MNLKPLSKKLLPSSDSDDRISDLPNEILQHILSFIPTLNSVATCILSARFKHVWKNVPKLSFDDAPPPLYVRTTSTDARFANFVTRVLKLHGARVLEKLYISCHANELYDFRQWVGDSIMKNIQFLDLVVHDSRRTPCDRRDASVARLPSNLFSCKTLESIKLRGEILVNVPTIVCVPKLKRMEFVRVDYYYDDKGGGFGKLISSCSSLESLVVEDREYLHHSDVKNRTVDNYIGDFTISSDTLRDVKIHLFESHSQLIGYNPEIFCSDLRRLNLKSCCKKKIKVPSNVFTCETLELLSLEGSFVICAAITICLPNLTSLSLLRVAYEDDEILSTIISSCTSLESVSVAKSITADLKIFSCTVKVLEAKLFCLPKPGHNLLINAPASGHKLVINAPALKCLKLKSSGYVDYDFEDIASLEQGDVNINFDDISYNHSGKVFAYIYRALRHVKRLKIFQHVCDGRFFESLVPIFNMLTEFDITISSCQNDLLQMFIMNSTRLEKLAVCVLNDKDSPYCYNYWRNPDIRPVFLVSSLRSVSINGFKGFGNELEMTKYFLEEARNMEMMEVCFSLYFHHISKMARRNLTDVMICIEKREAAKREVCNKILDFRRGSKKCEVLRMRNGIRHQY